MQSDGNEKDLFYCGFLLNFHTHLESFFPLGAVFSSATEKNPEEKTLCHGQR